MKKKITKTHCDFCSREIEKSTPEVVEFVDIDGRALRVNIRVSWLDNKRFTADICGACVFSAATSAAPKAEAPGDQI